MRTLKDRCEIAHEINIKRTTTVRIDLADSTEYGLRSQKITIDNGTFKDGTPYMVNAEIRAYCDEMKFTFSQYGTYLSSSFGYQDIEDMIEYANAPIVKPDSDVVLVIVNSKLKKACKPIVLHTSNRVNPNCSTPLTFIDDDNDASNYMLMYENADLRNKWIESRVRYMKQITK